MWKGWGLSRNALTFIRGGDLSCGGWKVWEVNSKASLWIVNDVGRGVKGMALDP